MFYTLGKLLFNNKNASEEALPELKKRADRTCKI